MVRALGISMLLLGACGHAPRRAGEVVIMEGAAPPGCVSVGEVEGRAATGLLSLPEASQRAEGELREAAARRGATHVSITSREDVGVTTVILGGTALDCGDP